MWHNFSGINMQQKLSGKIEEGGSRMGWTATWENNILKVLAKFLISADVKFSALFINIQM